MVDTINPAIKRESYNTYLYNKRNELGLKRRKFARMLKVPLFKYRLIENGYTKPSKKIVNKINNALDVDYSIYLTGESSYPTELPEKEKSALSAFLYGILANKVVRIILISLSVIFLSLFVTFRILSAYNDNHQEKFYSGDVVDLKELVVEKGSVNFSITGDTRFPQLSKKITDSEAHTEKLTMISSSYSDINFKLRFSTYYWCDDYRIVLIFNTMTDESILYDTQVFIYSSSKTFNNTLKINKYDGSITYSYNYDDYSDAMGYLDSFINSNDLYEDYNEVIKEYSEYDFDFENEILPSYSKSDSTYSNIIFTQGLIYLLSMVLGALSIFMTAYAFIYGSKGRKAQTFEHSDSFIDNKLYKPLKSDIRFTPFLPETVYEIIGIIIVAIGSFRIIMYASSFNQYSSGSISIAGNELLTLRMLGMFLLYFVDFDLFMDDKRVLRNIVLYPLLFLVIYYVEAAIMTYLANSNSLILNQFTTFLMPNPFGSVTCYFLIMVLLFFTPKSIKKKGWLIAYRLLSIIPIAYIFISFFLFNSEFFFNWKIDNYWVRYFFDSERLPFSILAVSYLVGLYLLRLYFKHKYGEENARRYFNGNKFLLIKNIFISIVVIIVWIVDLSLSGNSELTKIGIGCNGLLIILVPLLMLYHPHKGPRNLAVDYTTLALYVFSISYAYVIAALIVLVSLFI